MMNTTGFFMGSIEMEINYNAKICPLLRCADHSLSGSVPELSGISVGGLKMGVKGW